MDGRELVLISSFYFETKTSNIELRTISVYVFIVEAKSYGSEKK